MKCFVVSLLSIPLALSAPNPVTNPDPTPVAQSQSVVTVLPQCYTDIRQAPNNPDLTTLLTLLDADPNGTPDYPWEVSWGNAKIRVNGDTKIKKARAADEARWIRTYCTDGEGQVGGLLDMGSHRVRVSKVGT